MLTSLQNDFIIKNTVHNEVHAIEIADDSFDISLKNEEVLAIYVLGQMQNKMVRIQDSSRNWKQVGLLHIKEINGIENPDFSNSNNWNNIILNSITIKIYSASTWGTSTSTYSSVFQINEVSRFKEQV